MILINRTFPALLRLSPAVELFPQVCTESRDIQRQRVLSAHGFAPRAPPSTQWAPLGQLRFSF